MGPDRQTDGQTDGRLIEKHNCIVMRIDKDSSAYSESFKRVECTNWEYRRVRVTHQLPRSHGWTDGRTDAGDDNNPSAEEAEG